MDTYREFGGIENDIPSPSPSAPSIEVPADFDLRSNELVSFLREDIIGTNAPFRGPYGEKPTLYCDWTASGRCLKSIEGFVQSEVLPLYGNTHTTTSITGHQSTCYRDEARKLVAQAVNARITGRASEDVVLFVGNGTTGAIAKLIASLGLMLPLPSACDPNIDRPVIFVSSYEHHSNLVSWRETVAEVVVIAYHPLTGVSLLDLESKLQLYSHRKCKIGSFSAASNVTGVLTDVNSVSIVMHKAQGLVFFDYATAAPYVKIDMNPPLESEDSGMTYKDGIFFSGHKFIGGPGTSGVLVVKSRILPPRTGPPTEPGGGTVFYVADSHQRYLSNRVEREEAGTPNLISDVKLGLVMHLYISIGSDWIEREELRISSSVYAQLSSLPRVVLLGRPLEHSTSSKHLPIFSFLICFGSKFLHYNFVCALLNDLFGIQSRGGCSCAGPLSQSILGINASVNQDIEMLLLDKNEVYRPGYTRLSFPYFMEDSEIQFVVACIEFISLHGWKFLPQYKHNPKTGEFAHMTRMTKFPERKWLSNFNLTSAPENPAETVGLSDMACDYKSLLSDAMKEAAKAEASRELQYRMMQVPPLEEEAGDAEERLRWFILLNDVNKITAFELLSLRCPFDPSLFTSLSLTLINEGSSSRKDDEMGTAYARKRAAGNYVHHSTNAMKDRTPRYLQDSWRADGYTPVPEPFNVPLKPPAELNTTSTEVLYSEKRTVKDVVVNAMEGSSTVTDLNLNMEKPKIKAMQPPRKIMKLVGQAIRDWGLIQDGDRLLLGLSGGKDSMSLLHVLLALQKKAPIRFEIACCTIDPQTSSFDPSPLIPYMESLGIPYHFVSEPIIELAKTKMQGDSLCAFCARFKRGLLYATCRTHNYNKLVLAQHLDDLAESFYMSLNHNGVLRTMKANYAIEAGDVRVIRPLVYVRESLTRDFVKSARLPVINENCPACFEEPKERARVKKILQQEEAMVPALFSNLRRALLPLMHEKTYEAMKAVEADIERTGAAQQLQTVKRSREEGREEDDSNAAAAPEVSGLLDNKKCKSEPEMGDAIHHSLVQSRADVLLERDTQDEVTSERCTDTYCAPCYEIA